MTGAQAHDPLAGRAGWLRRARSYLRAADPVLARLIDDRPDFDPGAWMTQLPAMDLFGALLFQVTGQQLSVPATRRTLARIQAMFGGRLPSPAELLATDPGKFREAGLSWRKTGTLRDLAGRLSDGRLSQDALGDLPDDELMAELTVIPGIGPWTARSVTAAPPTRRRRRTGSWWPGCGRAASSRRRPGPPAERAGGPAGRWPGRPCAAPGRRAARRPPGRAR